MADHTPSDTDARPYRSHKIPACSICRHRKVRCILDSPSSPCRFCRARGLACEAAASKHRSRTSLAAHAGQRPGVTKTHRGSTLDCGSPSTARHDGGTTQPSPSTRAEDAITAHFTSPEESATMVMNPPMAEDLEVLDRYLTSAASGRRISTEPYVRVSSSAKDDSIVYLSLPRQRKGLQATVDPGRAQREIMEQVLGKHKEDVLNLYFQKIHPCLPIVDEDSFWLMWRKDPTRISSPLLCEMYAVSLVFWPCSAALVPLPQPDMAFAWNTAVTALRDDLLAPCMTTVHACLLAITGRPTIGVTGNVVKAGGMITLAHSLALHRDPTSWQISAAEKQLRINLWSAVVIHDYWSSYAHGTPPNIRQENCDVPLPASGGDVSPSFRQLCSLSAILGEILLLIYALRIDSREAEKSVRRLECRVDAWVDDLPACLKSGGVGADGACNLWFCLLSVKLLLCRVAYKTAIRNTNVLPEEKQYRLATLRDAAIQLAEYVRALDDLNLQEFWLPYTAYLLVSAATTLLRTAIESPHAAKVQCVRALLGFSSRLMVARETLGWDIGDFCLERCKPTIDKLASALGLSETDDRAVAQQQQQIEVASNRQQEQRGIENAAFGLESDLLLPLDSLDQQFDLFDDFAAPWPISL